MLSTKYSIDQGVAMPNQIRARKNIHDNVDLLTIMSVSTMLSLLVQWNWCSQNFHCGWVDLFTLMHSSVFKKKLNILKGVIENGNSKKGI